MRERVQGHFLRRCKASTAESMGQSFAQTSPLIVAIFCSTTLLSYHLGKNENNMMVKKGCGSGTRTAASPDWARFSACILASLPVIFNVASQNMRRWLLQRSNHLVSSACTAACICTYSVSFYSALPGFLMTVKPHLPRLPALLFNACLTLHATCDLLYTCKF